MQFKLFQFTALVIATVALVNAAPGAGSEVMEFNPDMANAEGATVIYEDDGETASTQDLVGFAWKGPSGTGSVGIINSYPNRCMVINTSWTNTITSIILKRDVYCNFYPTNRCGGYYVRVSGDYAPNLGGTWHDDAISSYRCYPYKK